MKLTTFSLTALAGSISAQYAGIDIATDVYADYPSKWTMKDATANGSLYYGDASIFIEGPDIHEIIRMPMYYGGFGMSGHEDPNQHAIPDANGNVYSMEKYVLKRFNVKIGQINIYNDNTITFSAVNDNLYKASLQIQQESSNPGDFGAAGDTNTCLFKLKSDKLYNLSSASFQCGMATLECATAKTPSRGWGTRKGNAIKNTYWMQFHPDTNPNQSYLHGRSYYTTSCNGGANEDEFQCEYDPSYYDDNWVPTAAEECIF